MKFDLRYGKGSLNLLITGIELCALALLIIFHSRWWALVIAYLGIAHIVSSVWGFCFADWFLNSCFKIPIKGKD